MEFKTSSILLILEGLAKKHNVALDHHSFGVLAEKLYAENINISQKYLYENMYLQATKAYEADEETVRLSKTYVNQILKALFTVLFCLLISLAHWSIDYTMLGNAYRVFETFELMLYSSIQEESLITTHDEARTSNYTKEIEQLVFIDVNEHALTLGDDRIIQQDVLQDLLQYLTQIDGLEAIYIDDHYAQNHKISDELSPFFQSQKPQVILPYSFEINQSASIHSPLYETSISAIDSPLLAQQDYAYRFAYPKTGVIQHYFLWSQDKQGNINRKSVAQTLLQRTQPERAREMPRLIPNGKIEMRFLVDLNSSMKENPITTYTADELTNGSKSIKSLEGKKIAFIGLFSHPRTTFSTIVKDNISVPLLTVNAYLNIATSSWLTLGSFANSYLLFITFSGLIAVITLPSFFYKKRTAQVIKGLFFSIGLIIVLSLINFHWFGIRIHFMAILLLSFVHSSIYYTISFFSKIRLL